LHNVLVAIDQELGEVPLDVAEVSELCSSSKLCEHAIAPSISERARTIIPVNFDAPDFRGHTEEINKRPA
jgi:hypothetical protein